MREANLVFLGTGDRDSIVDIFPFADQSEDDSGSPQLQALVEVKVTEVTLLDKIRFDLNKHVQKRVPGDLNEKAFNVDVERELERALELVPLARSMHPEVDHTRWWFLLTWQPTTEEEASDVSASVH